MSTSPSPVVSVTIVQAPLVDKDGRVTPSWVKWFQNMAAAVNAGLSKTGTAIKLPFPTTTTLGGVQSIPAAAGRWVSDIDAFGVPHSSRPSVSDISGLGVDATTATSANAGLATALPATPAGYVVLTVNNQQVKVPYFAL